MATEPTEGARRAAAGAFNFLAGIDWSQSGMDWKLARLAEIIDRETHSAEMRKALEAVIEWEEEYRTLNHLGKNPPNPFVMARAALKGGAL